VHDSKDPVCGREVDRSTTPWKASVAQRDFFFCSDQCRRDFEKDPARYGVAVESEPPYTESHGFVAPKFGSAASGGLENEPPPVDRRRKKQ
jgi:YHS domain-containing protein